MSFEVMGCNDAHVLLSPNLQHITDGSYEIVFGSNGNTLTNIRFMNGSGVASEAETPGIMRCNEFEKFWVEWDQEYIYIGTGDLNGYRLLSYYDPVNVPHLNEVSINTWYTTALEWRFLEEQCKKIIIIHYHKPSKERHNYNENIAEQTFLKCKVTPVTVCM